MTLGQAAVVADARDDQAMAGHLKSLLPGYLISQLEQFVALEFDQPLTLGAVEVIVLRVTVIVFVDGTTVQLEFVQ